MDKNWNKSDGRRFASYTDISNGNYKFRVRGSNSSGKFNPEEAVLKLLLPCHSGKPGGLDRLLR